MKTKRLTVPEAAGLLFTVLFCAFLFCTSRFDKVKTWPEVKIDFTDGKSAFSTAGGDSYGVKGYGPYFDLPAGRYRVKWQIDADGDNALHFTSSNEARIEPETVTMPAGCWEGEAVFELLDPAHSFSICPDFASGTRMSVVNLRLYSPGYKDNAFLALFAFAAFWSLYFLRKRGRLPGGALFSLAILCAASLFACAPSLSEDVVFGYDVSFHAARIMNLADELAALQLPGRVGGFSYNGWGAATSLFYPDLFLYPFALMILAGASITFVLNTLVLGTALLTGLLMFAAARRFLADDNAGLAAAILWTLCMYRLTDTYYSLMAGEMLAMAFLPLFLLGLHAVLCGDAGKWPLLVFSAFAIFSSHLVTTLICGGIAALALLLRLSALREAPRRRALGLTLLFTVLLCVHRLVPFAQFYLSGANTEAMQFGFAGSALPMRELFSANGRMGLLPWLGIAAALCALQEPGAPMKKPVCGLIAAGLAAVLLSVRFFPWSYVLAVTSLPTLIQFPWRFLCYASLAFSVCGGYGFSRLFRKRAVFLALALGVVCAMPYLNEVMEKKTGIEFGQGANPYIVNPEYQLSGTDVNDTRSRTPLLSDGLTLTAYDKRGTAVDAAVSAQQDGIVALPMFGFDGYEVRLDGAKADWTLSGNNRLTVAVPAGEHTLSVRYAGKLLWHALDLVSLASLAALIILLLRKRRCANA